MEKQTVFITGASSGIGRGTAKVFSGAGWRVALCARSQDRLIELRGEIRADGGEAEVFQADVTDTRQIRSAIEKANAYFDGIHAVIHCAGTNVKKTAEQLEDDEWDCILDTNLKSAYRIAQASLPLLEKSAKECAAKFLVIGSAGSYLGIPMSSAYCASKGGLVQFIRALAVEWASKNVCVNAVCPGYIRTKMSEATFRIGNTYERILDRIPMRRIGLPEDIGNALLFLASAKSDYITGTTLNVDGGLLSAAYLMNE